MVLFEMAEEIITKDPQTARREVGSLLMIQSEYLTLERMDEWNRAQAARLSGCRVRGRESR